MYGHHITPRPKTPIAARLRGFFFFHHAYGVTEKDTPDWCDYRYAEAWPFRLRQASE